MDNRVNVIYRDPDGIIWFGTYAGISRYDGQQFTTFLKGCEIWAIHHDDNGVLWFGTKEDVYRYDGTVGAGFDTQVRPVSVGINSAIPSIGATQPKGLKSALTSLTTADGLVNNRVHAINHDEDGVLWFGTEGGVSRYDERGFVNFTTADGLANNRINVIHRDLNGVLWFGTNGGASCYDRKGILNYTTSDGLVDNKINAIHGDVSGALWFATNGGVSRYDGKTFLNLTAKDGLVNNKTNDICQTPDGLLWFANDAGLFRYDGRKFDSLEGESTLLPNKVNVIHVSPDGTLWFGIYPSWGDFAGVSRYDGKKFSDFVTTNGLAGPNVRDIGSDANGVLWFGTVKGVSRYDGKLSLAESRESGGFINFTQEDGLLSNRVWAIYCGEYGTVWFGTEGGVSRGVYPEGSRRDGQIFTTETRLGRYQVFAIHGSSDGTFWFGTYSRGVVVYDGNAFTSLDTPDGLADNAVYDIYEDSEGYLWFGTGKGITRYKRSKTKPAVSIVSVQTDRKYTDLTAIPPTTSGKHVVIEYHAIDFKTHSEKRQYRYRITSCEPVNQFTGKITNQNQPSATRNKDNPYNPPTKATTFEWKPQKAGNYIFEVQAIDRDLNYSNPASVILKVVPPWYLNGWIAIPSGGAILVFLLASTFFTSRYFAQKKQSKRLREQLLEQERQKNVALQKASEEAEAAKRVAETANQAKSIFLASMNHDIRTPLNAILGYSQILKRESDLQTHQRSAVETIERSGNHLLGIFEE